MTINVPNWLHPQNTIVTASARLARRLSWQFTAARMAAGEPVWETLDILPWQRWLDRLWSWHQWADANAEVKISAAQSHLLWQQILEASPQRKRMLQPATVAERAMDGWQLLQEWGLPAFPDGVFLNEDARAFRAWAKAYQEKCAEHRWLDEFALVGELTRIVQKSGPVDQRPLVFMGFDDLAPARAGLLDALAQSGVPVSRPSSRAVPGARRRSSYTDIRAEILASARWAKTCIEKNPAATIGVVIPGLQSRRTAVQEIYADVLTPAALLQASDAAASIFSIAVGHPLSTQMVIDYGFLLLGFATGSAALTDVAALLRSPYVHGAEAEAAQRALFDARLRQRREPELALDTLLAEGERQSEPALKPTVLLDSLRVLRDRSRELPRRQTAAVWARAFSELLKQTGWPGDRTFTSVEYQALNAWRELLGELASLDSMADPMSFSGALGHLRRLAAERPFQPQTAEAPIQIIEMAGAADMGFDHLWVMGLHEEAWPPTAQPNPFLPLTLQREYVMPHSSAEGELQRARRITHALLNSCADVVVSWPEHEGERGLRPSPLILKLALAAPDLSAPQTWVQSTYGTRAVEFFTDNNGPALVAGMDVRGGAGLFKDQAACPFRAFARHRLLARSLGEADVGLDAMERGNLVHRVLQLFWQAVRTQPALLALSGSELDALIEQSVTRTLDSAARQRPQTFTARFTTVERHRLHTLTREWLEGERTRQPFEVVACEQARDFQLGGIRGQLRVDRLDKLQDETLIVIDYKTGNVPTHPWDGDRPEEPQLPLYAITTGDAVSAVTFARVRRGNHEFKGVAATSDALPGVKESVVWQELQDSWRRTLLALAAEFEVGNALVSPRNGDQTCRTCDLHGFCRVHELAATREETDGDDHGE